MKDIIDYYESGGNANLSAADRAEMKKQAKRWQEDLDKEYYDNQNPVGRNQLYIILRNKADSIIGKYPTKRFVGSWLRRQMTNQVNRAAPKSAPSIQSVITSKPNELLQIDYVYFYRHLGNEPLVEDTATPAEIKVRNALFRKRYGRGKIYQGCITAIDGFSRVGYAVPIEGNINSKKAWKAFLTIRADAMKRYKTEIKKIQTDKGSEFEGAFRKGMKGLAEQHSGFYKHHYGYTGRSQTQGIVERFNGTLKRLLKRHLNFRLAKDWVTHLDKAVSNYNSNPHRVIKMAPSDVKPANYKEVKRNILDRAKRSKRFQGVVYKEGDFVRLKIYKADNRKPSFTFEKGPLYTMTKRRVYQGVYMINTVNRPSGKNSIGKAPTYSVIAKWSKESTPDWYEANQELGGTLPSGVKLPPGRIKITIPGHVLNQDSYDRGAFPRKFLKDELVRVPANSKTGNPIAARYIGPDDEPEVVEPEPVKAKAKAKPVLVYPKVKVGSKIKVRYYDTPTGSRPYTEDARKRKVGKQKQWYEGEVKKIDKDKNEYSVYFPSDKETNKLNLSDTSSKDYLKEGHGWKV